MGEKNFTPTMAQSVHTRAPRMASGAPSMTRSNRSGASQPDGTRSLAPVVDISKITQSMLLEFVINFAVLNVRNRSEERWSPAAPIRCRSPKGRSNDLVMAMLSLFLRGRV